MADDREERDDDVQSGEEAQAAEPRYRSGRPARGSDFQRSVLERLAAELLKRGFEAGRDTLRQTDEALKSVGESVFTKEISHHINTQVGDIRDSVTRAVAVEIGRFLRQADLASEMRRMLSGMTIETKIKLKFPDEEEGGEEDGDQDETTGEKGRRTEGNDLG